MKSEPERLLPPCFKLYACGQVAEDPTVKQRFTRHFAEVWDLLPSQDTERIATAAASMTAEIEVQLRDHHHSLQTGPSKGASAQVIRHLGSFEMIFASQFARGLPDQQCRYWIAHELAHVLLFIIDPAHGAPYETAEAQVAKLLVERWKFEAEDESYLNAAVHIVKTGVSLRE